MVFLRNISPPEARAVIHGDRVYLRVPTMNDYSAWVQLRAASRNYLTPWEPLWPHDDLARNSFRYRIRRYNRDIREDTSYPFFIFDITDHTLLGGVTVSGIHRGVAQSGSLGYWIGEKHSNRGNMSAAVNALIPYAFEELNLNRLEAACLPTNVPSMHLLRRCGFTQEGYAREYLKINGKWRDHMLFALLRRDVPR